MRVQLPGIIRRVFRKDGRVSDALHSRRTGERSPRQAAEAVSFAVYSAAQDGGDCRCYGCTSRRGTLRQGR
jgi:hypothetical protein